MTSIACFVVRPKDLKESTRRCSRCNTRTILHNSTLMLTTFVVTLLQTHAKGSISVLSKEIPLIHMA